MAEYVIYLRKSRADLEAESRGEGETLARHRAALLEVAKRQSLVITHIYSEVVSGETIAARPMMQQLLSEVEQGVWSGVLVMEVERLARGDTIDQGIVAQAFKFSDTKIVTPVKTYDPTNEFDEEYFEFGLFMSRREYKTITRRMQRGRVASVQEGRFVGNKPPYGYERVKIQGDKGYTLQPIPEQSQVVNLIFEWYVYGVSTSESTTERLGYSKIAQRLDEMHCPTISGAKWSTGTIKEILTNPAYIGKVRWNRRPQVKHVEDGKIVSQRPRAKEDSVTIADGLHPAIISTELFETTQVFLKMRLQSPIPKGRVIQNPLAKIVVCGMCGKSMIRKPYNNAPDTILCATRGCPNISSHLHYVEERLLFLLENWLRKYKLETAKSSPNFKNTELAVIQQQKIKLSHELKKIEQQLDQLHDLLEQGVYSVDVFVERSKKLSIKRDQSAKDLDDIEVSLTAYEQRSQKQETLIPKMEKILELYKVAVNPKEKNDLLRQILQKAVYVKTKSGHFAGNSPDDFDLSIYPFLP